MSIAIHASSAIKNIFFGIVSLILTIPLFIFVYHWLPDFQWPLHSEKILAFILIAILLLLMFRSFKFILITAVFAIIGWLWYGSLTGRYGFKELYQDGKVVLYAMQNNSNTKVVFTGTRSLGTDQEIINAIDYKNPVVRDFAVDAANEYFSDQQGTKMKYRTFVQCMAVFKKINENWNYVNDPQDEEYIAKASESVKLLAGDCDDHSILMAAAIKSIGGVPRLVYTKGHIYPEILVGNRRDFETVSSLIRRKLFPEEIGGRTINYHKDDSGNIWLNLDYTASYPGGKFMGSDVIEALYP
jgi:hypothetical protein